MELVGRSEFAKVIKSKNNQNRRVNFFMNLLKINELNEVYAKLADRNTVDFLSQALKEFGVQIQFNQEGLAYIPSSGPFITISNHPYGGLDGVILLHTVLSRRNDFKVMGNFLLQKIGPIHDYIVPVNPFENKPELGNNLLGLRQALNMIKSGGGLGIFPAGEVSSLSKDNHRVGDKKWNNSIIRFIQKANVPVVPIHFSGGNSLAFHALGLVHPTLRTAKLPSELFNKKDKVIRFTIGKAISVEEQNSFVDTEQFGRYLRAKTYLAKNQPDVKKIFAQPVFQIKKVESLIPSVEPKYLQQEIDSLDNSCTLFKIKDIQAICVEFSEISLCMQEIGMLREKTFREVGEGTNKKTDLDEFDIYYKQLFLWDNSRKRIVGAYRIGLGKDIMHTYGIKGFYTHSLFRMNKQFYPLLEQTMELGRSFIVKEYQKKTASLFLLWKGLLIYLLKNPEYRFLLGPVSISNKYSSLSRSLLIEFIRSYYFDSYYSKYIKPRKKYRINDKALDANILVQPLHGDVKKMDKVIQEIESDNSKVPVLLKKYLQLNGKILGFNLDPKFNDALDGLLLLDVFDIPKDMISSLSKDI